MVRIQQKKNGQYVVTIDKGIADAMDLAGAEAEWKIDSANALKLKINERGDDGE